MREKENIRELLEFNPDYMGLIFFPGSPRYVGFLEADIIQELKDANISLVGVFVNENSQEILKRVREFELDFVQLHGDETVDQAEPLRDQGVKLIKVFRIESKLPVEEIKMWEPLVEFFLFDTAGKNYGGNAKHFSWHVLQGYPGQKPFFLSGGIDVADLAAIKQLGLPQLHGVDVNSKMEISPGRKSMEKINALSEAIC